jgi:hypothetical protein
MVFIEIFLFAIMVNIGFKKASEDIWIDALIMTINGSK